MLFSWKRRRADPLASSKDDNPLPLSELDWSAYESSKGWPFIKVWLKPETVNQLDQLAGYRHQTRSEVMRDLLFIALYGHFVYAQLLAERRGLLRELGQLHSGERVLFDITVNKQCPNESPRREKKIENIRLFLPAPMKEAIESMAASPQATVSHCVRDLIERQLNGMSAVLKRNG